MTAQWAPRPLRQIGYWSGGTGDNSQFPDVNDFVDPSWWEVDMLLAYSYLQRGLTTRAWMGNSLCRVCGQSNGNLDFTDGTYVWPEGLAHYVRDHSVRLPEEFLDHIRVTNDRLEEMVYDEQWWIRSVIVP